MFQLLQPMGGVLARPLLRDGWVAVVACEAGVNATRAAESRSARICMIFTFSSKKSFLSAGFSGVTNEVVFQGEMDLGLKNAKICKRSERFQAEIP
jgi:hypothetical protein